MRPVPIPEQHRWEGAEVHTMHPPEGVPTEECNAVDVLTDVVTLGGQSVRRYSARIMVSAADLEQLARDGHFWVSILAPALPPFQVWMPEG